MFIVKENSHFLIMNLKITKDKKFTNILKDKKSVLERISVDYKNEVKIPKDKLN